jgi:hypothetical protein
MSRFESYLKKIEANGNSVDTISTSLKNFLGMFGNDVDTADAVAKEHGYSITSWDGNETAMVTLSKNEISAELKEAAAQKWGKRMPQAVKTADNPFTV